jgi:hypothetical protein
MPVACPQASVCSIEVIYADVVTVGVAFVATSSSLSESGTTSLSRFPCADLMVVEYLSSISVQC